MRLKGERYGKRGGRRRIMIMLKLSRQPAIALMKQAECMCWLIRVFCSANEHCFSCSNLQESHSIKTALQPQLELNSLRVFEFLECAYTLEANMLWTKLLLLQSAMPQRIPHECHLRPQMHAVAR